jgi:hypothetical protein
MFFCLSSVIFLYRICPMFVTLSTPGHVVGLCVVSFSGILDTPAILTKVSFQDTIYLVHVVCRKVLFSAIFPL